MVKKLTLIVLFLFLIPLATSVSTNSISDIDVTLTSQSPDPVEPGQIVTVKFKIENSGAESQDDIILRILPNFPFSLYGESAERNVGRLRGDSNVVVTYKLKIDEAAIEDDTELELELEMGNTKVRYISDEFTIDIQTHDAVLDISSIKLDPQQIPPGETSEVTIMVKNMADSLLKDIRFKLNFNDLPLAPYQSSSESRIAQLISNYQNSLSFELIADPDATPGLYKIPLNITYNDEKGNDYSISDFLAVTIGDTPKVKLYIKKTSVLQTETAGKITLTIVNSGSTNVKFLELFLLDSEDYQLITPSDYFYIGDVDSDDTESEEIDVYINKKVDTLHFPVRLKYHDANNKPFQQQFDLEMNLYSSSQLKKFGVIESSNAWIYLLILIVGVGGYFYYKKYYKKSKKLKLKQVLTNK